MTEEMRMPAGMARDDGEPMAAPTVRHRRSGRNTAPERQAAAEQTRPGQSPEASQAEAYQAEAYQAETYQAETYQAETYQTGSEQAEAYQTGNLGRGNARFGEAQRMTASQPQVVLPPQYDPYTAVTGAQPWVSGEQSPVQVPWASGAQPVYGWQNQFTYGTHPGAPVYPQGQVPMQPGRQKSAGDPARAAAKDSKRAARGKSGRAGKEPNPRLLTGILCAVAAVALLAGAWFGLIGPAIDRHNQAGAAEERRLFLEEQVGAYNDKYCPGVWVDKIDLGGLTQQEARTLVMQAAEVNLTWNVQLIWEGEVYATLTEADLGIIVDVEGALERAWHQGHDGDYEARWAAMQRLQSEPYHDSSATETGDAGALETSLRQLADSLYVAPVDAVFLGFDPNLTDPLIFQKDVPGRTLDIDSIRRQALTESLGRACGR